MPWARVRGGLGTGLGLAAAGVALWALSGPAWAAERVALVIGNAEYHDPDAKLRNPGNDADAMAAALGRLGFEVVLGKDLDTDGFYDKLKEYHEASRGADVTLFFYAGHGLQVQGKNWLVPVDARLESKLDLERGAVELDTVLEHMRGTKRLVYLDACRNNPLARGLAGTMGMSRTAASNRGLARVRSGSGTLIGYATAPDDVASDGDERAANSPFTKALLAHVETPGLSVNDMFGEVSEAVSRATRGAQVPWSHSSLGRFYLRPGPSGGTTASGEGKEDEDTKPLGGGTVVKPPSGASARAAYEAAERAAERLGDRGVVAAYRIVVEDFPGTTYAKLAQTWIDEYEAAEGERKAERERKAREAERLRADDEAFARAKRQHTASGYREYLSSCGVCGHESEAEDLLAETTPPDLSPEEEERGLGLDGEERRLVQMALASAGHDPGPADGVLGGRTRKALRAWQESKELAETGYLTRGQSEGLVALGREEAERRRAEEERKRKAREAAERQERERQRAEEAERLRRLQEPGRKFRDCPDCPELVVVPSGSFMMGSPRSESGRRNNGGPVHRVTFARPFAVGVYEVTFGEWEACVSGGGCGGHRPDDEGWGRGSRPVVNVSWEDARSYVRWLSGETGKEYRLLSESEWEYAARAGTRTRYWWGDAIRRNRANCNGCGSRWDGEKTAPVGSFSANRFGLHDVLGNVLEWVEDCWNGSYRGAPTDGSARESGMCARRVLRGGSWLSIPQTLRSADRGRGPAGYRSLNVGFRVARTLD